MSRFVPRQTFAVPDAIPKTYFLGHHHAGIEKIKTILPQISLVLECRDARLPLSTHNPYLERILAGRDRLLVYTKSDLITNTPTPTYYASSSPEASSSSTSTSTSEGGRRALGAKDALRRIYGRDRVVFWDKNSAASTRSLVAKLKARAVALDSLTGMRALVVGMPNVGKSTLLNALRSGGVRGRTAKAARTGDQAGVTRRVGTSVRVIEPDPAAGLHAGVYVLDTPGIFQPYLDSGETMIKVALANGIKKGLIDDEILADYLLYRLNLWRAPALDAYLPAPTDDVNELLAAVARRDGKLRRGARPNLQEAAARLLSRWRAGDLGRYVLDDLSEEGVRAHQLMLAEEKLSITQARKHDKAERMAARESRA